MIWKIQMFRLDKVNISLLFWPVKFEVVWMKLQCLMNVFQNNHLPMQLYSLLMNQYSLSSAVWEITNFQI